MRLRDLTETERRGIDARREAVRAALADVDAPWKPTAAAIDAAPFLDDWDVRPYPGTDRPCLEGLCWGHPVHGDRIVTTSIVVHRGEGFAVVESGRTYLLGKSRPEPEARLNRILAGRRGAGRPAQVIEREGPDIGDLDHLPSYGG